MFEVEQKFRVDRPDKLQTLIDRVGGKQGNTETHEDTYYNHPSRDFAQTGEAFRIRRINGIPLVTYKGPKLTGPMKARQEMEWRLDPGDPQGNQTEELLQVLGFQRVATVRKQRRPYEVAGDFQQIKILVDQVDSLGVFVELERLVADQSQIEPARAEICELSTELGLRTEEPRSYLEMVLECDSGNL